MKRLLIAGVPLAAGLLVALAAGTALADSRAMITGSAKLNGYKEVPSVSTTGHGSFKFTIDTDASTINYELAYDELEGGAVSAAHIHLSQPRVAGGVIAFLCGGGDKPACPQSGSVTGVIDPADVIGPSGQGITNGEFGEAVRAIRNGAVYANVHTQAFPSGEIRGQLGLGSGDQG